MAKKKLKKPTYPGHDLYVGMPTSGGHIKRVQRALNTDRVKNPKDDATQPKLVVDGEYGAKSEERVKQFQKHHDLTVDGVVGRGTWAKLFGEKKAPKPKPTLAERAFKVAEGLVGVVEVGGNNVGPMVSKIIRGNGGTPGEPWCGDFVAFCYRSAGSKVVQRLWASVYYLGRLAGLVLTKNPSRGDIVRYVFDHTGLFDRWRPDLGPGYFEAIEGNTTSTGAVSDSNSGHDGVKRKIRHISQVTDFRRVTR